MRGRFTCLAVLTVAAVLGGCRFKVNGLEEKSEYYFHRWPAPTYGTWLCLAVPVDAPIYARYDGREIIGYTRDMIAFQGTQIGHFIQIVPYQYTGSVAWVDGLLVRPYGDTHPGKTCVVEGEDLYHRPIFIVRKAQ